MIKEQNRINVIDGLRAFAVLGVIWVHNWSFWFGAPNLIILKVDINRLLSVFGTGVDLFFVISGFCMYLIYGRISKHNFTNFLTFIKKRYIRIVPAYIASVIVSGLWVWYSYGQTQWISYLISYLTFTNTFFEDPSLPSHYWSLAVEFQFYLLIPIFFILQNRIGFWKSWLTFMIISLLLTLFIFALRLPNFVETYDNKIGFLYKYSILFRFPEFGWGMAACRIYIDTKEMPAFLKGLMGFILGISILYFGKAIDTTEVINIFLYSGIDLIIRTLSYPLLSLGYAIILINLIYSSNLIVSFFNNQLMLLLGKLSYSIYLWHWIIGQEIAKLSIYLFGISVLNQWLTFIIQILLLIPLGWLSYEIFEKFYFKIYSTNTIKITKIENV